MTISTPAAASTTRPFTVPKAVERYARGERWGSAFHQKVLRSKARRLGLIPR